MESVKSLELSFSHFHKRRTQTEAPENNPYMYIILTDIIREYLILTERSDSPAPPDWLTQLVNQLSQPENAVRTRAEILSGLHYSQEHICRVFKMYMHETLTDFINNKRLDHAAMLLHSTGKNVCEVCHECGFSSIAYFTRLFKARFGVSPSVYKRSPVG